VSWATTIGVESTNVFITVDWYDKPFFECIQELCSSSGSDFYVNASLDAQFFAVGSRRNVTDAIVHTKNLFEIKEFTPDLTQIRNVIRVYGAEINGIQPFFTAKSSGGDYGYDTDFGEHREIIRDDNITSFSQAKTIAEAVLSERIVPPNTGECVSFLLATLLPGEQLLVSSPSNGIEPGYYSSNGYKDTLDYNSKLTTTVYLNRSPRTISHVIKSQIQSKNKTLSNPLNKYDSDNSYDFGFDIDSGNHSSTEISEGHLRLSSGSASGSWISDIRETDSDVITATLRIRGNNLNNIKVYVSGNGGVNYEEVTSSSVLTLSSSLGRSLCIKTIFSGEAEVDSLSIQYTES
jgi:hypothetical protein